MGQGTPSWRRERFSQITESGKSASMILWGPPLDPEKQHWQRLITHVQNRTFFSSMPLTRVKEIRETLEKHKNSIFDQPNPILFIDEISLF